MSAPPGTRTPNLLIKSQNIIDPVLTAIVGISSVSSR